MQNAKCKMQKEMQNEDAKSGHWMRMLRFAF
jgi:hypothetical protein